ncbi:MAG: SpoIIE family protein phosphatase [Bryobacteraceae bacterium]|nr:SpoIIE family protein phosphatase [Bryobacteraceae bacterium]
MDGRTDARLDASRLESLLESAKLLSASLELDELLKHLLRTVMGRLLCLRGAVAIHEEDGLRVAQSRGVTALKTGQPFSSAIAAEAGLSMVFPIGDASAPAGLLALSPSKRGPLDESENEFLEALLGLAASSIENAKAHRQVVLANRSLDQKVQELRTLLDLGRGLASTIDVDELARMLLLTLSGRFAVRRHALFTWKAGQPPIQRVKGLEELDAAALQREASALEGPTLRDGRLLLPIRASAETQGIVVLGPRALNLPYGESDLDFAQGLMAQAAVAFENAWHFRDTLYRQQIEQELTLAATIQKDLFPKRLPDLASTFMAARNRQARQVGGDYFDVLYAGPEVSLLCVADISGKGIAASLLMANLQATLRALLSAGPPIIELAGKTSDLLYASTPAAKYATAFFMKYRPESGACEYVNGGHNEGIVLRASGEVELLNATGMPVGLLPNRTYESGALQLDPGDLLALYTDGVTEADNLEEEEFGLDRTIECLKAHRDEEPERILDHLFEAIDGFAGGAPQHDDITALVLKRT